ncbi:hypothetical protein GOP47_0009639 [Adiantum capillus-veneris]|uniref:RanBP2-type domain-containing protein n=1 Tax=Adiantum capillus-veneris TaxID=13818 RepID=A0A9D4ZHC3_ADICA|nr:hypothetical protein GOP47_0009639 [Adiantum capillus-veneris]
MDADLAVALVITAFFLFIAPHHRTLLAAVCKAITWDTHRSIQDVMLTLGSAFTAAWLLKSRACAFYTLSILTLVHTLVFNLCPWELSLTESQRALMLAIVLVFFVAILTSLCLLPTGRSRQRSHAPLSRAPDGPITWTCPNCHSPNGVFLSTCEQCHRDLPPNNQ